MKILGIETSCDETAASVVEDGTRILSNVVVSQIDIFAAYGGVIPEVAARSHLEAILPVIDKALEDAHCTWASIDAIAVTHAPGLLGSLLVGTLTARTLAILHNKPLYAVHHLKSHVYANWLNAGARVTENIFSPDNFRLSSPETYIPDAAEKAARRAGFPGLPAYDVEGELAGRTRIPTFPLLALVISGGHTQILYMPAHNQFEIIGTTHDDAIGECFDKVAKILGLPYPGGPSIAQAASGELPATEPRSTLKAPESTSEAASSAKITPGDPHKYAFPHPKTADPLDFSFSGLKTAVLRAVQRELGLPISHPSHDLKHHLTPQQVADFAASFQQTAISILLEKLAAAMAQRPDAKSLVFAGGVSANRELRQAATALLSEAHSPRIYFPAPNLSGDNGAMVAAAAFYEIQSGVAPTDPYTLNIYPRIAIDS